MAGVASSPKSEPHVNYLGAPDDGLANGIHNLDQSGWVKISAIMDSGAAESVAPPGLASHIPLRESEASRRGQVYHTADGTKIPNLGERVVQTETEDGQRYNLTYQVASVTKPLNSVSKICDKGNIVVFTSDGGFVQNSWTGQRTCFAREHGVYVMHSWVEVGSKGRGSSDFSRREM